MEIADDAFDPPIEVGEFLFVAANDTQGRPFGDKLGN